ncbi:hypothetical protein AMS68_002761 [Peltaster fructicola]|uniref:Fumarylacetoacetase n=1 Tax=Peltaster fructicola TaxID=286661 RepID=A0A6H0XR82_9PEZI|nr:hypothetical protein AMS68_002761 [Peltaster fructicola]
MPALLLDKLPHTIHSLPYGVITTSSKPQARCAVAIGDHAIDLAAFAKTGHFNSVAVDLVSIFAESSLNSFAALDWTVRKAVRTHLQDAIRDDKIPEHCLVLLSDVQPHLPMEIPGFSDFYSSLEHCQNCSGEMTTKSIAKNWWYAPSVYNSRTSSVLPSPGDFTRPTGVSFDNGIDTTPIYGPCRKLDFELEMGYFVSKPVPYGETLSIAEAKEHIFGFVMLNDWSARDHQLFEMRPLGPFHSKGFATSISNWIVPLEALEPFSVPPNTKQDPPPFEHLTWPTWNNGALDIKLRVKLVRDGKEKELSTSNLRYMYWTPYQQLTHHAASGCGLRTGDLMGTGTISGSGVNAQGGKAELGCLYEAERTKTALLPQSTAKYQDGYLEDDDEIILEGWCEDTSGKAVLGFSEARAKVKAPSAR